MDIKNLPLNELIYKLTEAQEQETNAKHLVRIFQDEIKKRYKNGDLSRDDKHETKKTGGIF